ncbi:YeiH family protein [Enterococcus sp. LJL98]
MISTKGRKIVGKYPILPGLLLSVIVAGCAKLVAIFLPQLGGATLAILFGIFLGNTFFKQTFLQVGTKFAESKLLEFSVVLLGLTVTFQTIAEMGMEGLLYTFLLMVGTILFTYQIGKKLGFNSQMSLLMSGGNAVCGSSAIASIAPEVHAKEEEKGQIITLVNLLGTIMMLTLPFLANGLFGENVLAKSALLGGTLQSVGQVVAGASLIDENVLQYAMLFKIIRIMGLALVVYAFGQFAKKQNLAGELTSVQKKKFPLPWYIIGFLAFCILNSFFTLPDLFVTSAKFTSNWFETTALAAIGLRLDLVRFLKEGPRFLIYGLSVGTFQTIVAALLIFLFFA